MICAILASSEGALWLVDKPECSSDPRSTKNSEVPACGTASPLGKEKSMIDNESWRISIEQSAAFVGEQIGYETVQAIFNNYNASGLEDLNPCYYSEVFNELYAYETDLRN